MRHHDQERKKSSVLTIGLILVAAIELTACKSQSTESAVQDAVETTIHGATVQPSFYPITGVTDIIRQNRVITRNYHVGATALQQALFRGKDGPFQANWLHFGIWGSLRAGESIDGTDAQLAYSAQEFTFTSLEQSLGWLPSGIREDSINSLRRDNDLINTLTKILKQSLAGGNRRVADEIMGLTDRYIKSLGCAQTFDEAELKKFLGTFEYQLDRDAPIADVWGLLLADIPNLAKGKTHRFGQDALARAYEAYHRAKFETDPLIQSQMMHYGNLLIAIHEQFVLQTYISGAMGILEPAGGLSKKVATVWAMDIGLPGPGFKGVARSGEGLRRYPLRSGFAPRGFTHALKTYTWAPLAELARVTGVDQNAGRGATDWTDYPSRVYLIAGMLRTFQNNPSVGLYPYTGPNNDIMVTCP